MQEISEEDRPIGGRLSWVQRLGLAGLVLVGLALAADLAFGAAMAGRIYPGVKIAGQNLAGLTRSQAISVLKNQSDKYQLKLTVAGKTFVAKPDQLGASFDPAATVGSAYLIGRHQPLALLGLLDSMRPDKLAYSFAVDDSQLRDYIHNIAAQIGVAPQDATIIVKAGVPSVQVDQDGRSVEAGRLIRLVEDSLATGQPADVSLSPVAVKADIVATDLPTVIEATKQIVATPVTLTYGDQLFRPNSKLIGSWLKFDKIGTEGDFSLKPNIDTTQVKDYVQSVANQIDVAPVNKQITVKNGQSTVDQEGADGLAMDQDGVVKAIVAGLLASRPVTYAITTKPVPYKTLTNQVVTLDIGTYIEVNLSLQHLWVYQDHNVIYDTPITSGATGAGLGTVTGLFSIYYKTTNTRLRGYQYGWNYDVPVKYWMPFYKGYGLHDAVWRNGNFGGPDYYYAGSHGCVNLPDAAAEFIYNWSVVGTPVWVHN